MQIEISDSAQWDLNEIWGYIAENSEGNADKVIDRIGAKFERLKTTP